MQEHLLKDISSEGLYHLSTPCCLQHTLCRPITVLGLRKKTFQNRTCANDWKLLSKENLRKFSWHTWNFLLKVTFKSYFRKKTFQCVMTLMSLDLTTKTRWMWPTLPVKIACQESWACVNTFKPAEPHSPWDACYWFAIVGLDAIICNVSLYFYMVSMLCDFSGTCWRYNILYAWWPVSGSSQHAAGTWSFCICLVLV